MAVEFADSEGAFRCRTEGLKEIHFDAISSEDISYGLSEEASVVTAVVSYNYANGCVRAKCFEATFFRYFKEVVGIALRSLCQIGRASCRERV